MEMLKETTNGLCFIFARNEKTFPMTKREPICYEIYYIKVGLVARPAD